MNNVQTNRTEMLIRVTGFGESRAAAFPASSLGGQKFAALNTVVEELEQRRTAQTASGNAAKMSTGVKKAARERVRQIMAAMSETARTMESSRPGISASFRLPNTKGDQAWLSAGRSFVQAAAPLEEEFIRREMPDDFLEDLRSALDALQNACDIHNQHREQRVAATAAIDAVIERGMALVRELDAIVHNKFRGDEATLAAWESARHVERSARRRAATSASPPA